MNRGTAPTSTISVIRTTFVADVAGEHCEARRIDLDADLDGRSICLIGQRVGRVTAVAPVTVHGPSFIAFTQESNMQQLEKAQSELVHGGGASSPTPLPASRPAPIFKPLFPFEP